MSRQNSASGHSHSSDHSFPFQNDEDDTATHPTLLPNGILNDDEEDEEDVLPAWPRKQSLGSSSTAKETDAAPQTAILQCRHLPTDLTAREFSGLFTFADGYLDSNLAEASSLERIGTARFNSRQNAAKARAKMQQVPAYAQVEFDISGASSGALEMPTPPATLSTSSKSTGSSGSMQHSRLSSYVKDKTDLQAAAGISGLSTSTHTALGVEDFYGPTATGPLGGSSLPKGSLGLISSSVPTNFSTSATGTVWSPTSPRFASVTGESLAKSPPAGFSMLPPPQSTKEEDGWARNTARFQSLNLGNGGGAGTMNQGRATAAGALSVLAKGARSPTLSQGFPSIDKSLGSPHLNGNAPSFTKLVSSSSQGQGALHSQQQQQQGFQNGGVAMDFNSPPKQHGMMMPAQGHYAPMNPAANGFMVANRLGPALINTNPADQNPPCNTLYVGNLPLATTEEELKSLFSRQPGYRRLCYRTKSNGPMCFVEFEDVHYAIGALKLLQGVILSSSIKGGIRLSFSKNPLGVRKMDTAAGAGLMSGYAPGHGMPGPGHNGPSASQQLSQQHASLQLNGGGAHGHGGQHGMGGYAPQAPPGFAAAANGTGHGHSNGHLHSQGHLVHSQQQHPHHQHQQQHSQQGMSMFAPPQQQQSHPPQASVNPVWR